MSTTADNRSYRQTIVARLREALHDDAQANSHVLMGEAAAEIERLQGIVHDLCNEVRELRFGTFPAESAT